VERERDCCERDRERDCCERDRERALACASIAGEREEENREEKAHSWRTKACSFLSAVYTHTHTHTHTYPFLHAQTHKRLAVLFKGARAREHHLGLLYHTCVQSNENESENPRGGGSSCARKWAGVGASGYGAFSQTLEKI